MKRLACSFHPPSLMFRLTSNYTWRDSLLAILVGHINYCFHNHRTSLGLGIFLESLHHLPYPPGPKPWPLFRNISDIATSNQAQAYQDLTKRYGTEPLRWTIALRSLDGLVLLSVSGAIILFCLLFPPCKRTIRKKVCKLWRSRYGCNERRVVRSFRRRLISVNRPPRVVSTEWARNFGFAETCATDLVP
jgi:hypothetical protein